MCQELFWALSKWQFLEKANRGAEILAPVRASHVSLNF